MQNLFIEALVHLPRLGLGEHVCQVVLGWDASDPTHTGCTALPDIVGGNGVALLLQLGGWVAAVVDHGHVVCLDKSLSIQWDPHHAQLVAKPLNHLHSCLHGRQLRAKRGGLNGALLLAVPCNGCHSQEDDHTSPGPPVDQVYDPHYPSEVFSVVDARDKNFVRHSTRCIDHHMQSNVFIQ